MRRKGFPARSTNSTLSGGDLVREGGTGVKRQAISKITQLNAAPATKIKNNAAGLTFIYGRLSQTCT